MRNPAAAGTGTARAASGDRISSSSAGSDATRPGAWTVRDRVLSLRNPVVMGILNTTPDSFSDGGELPDVPAALRRAETMLDEGATVLDVGGESTRPGADPVPEAREIERVVPVVEALVSRLDATVSVDTRKAAVARAALDAGARVVNDVSGLAWDPAMAAVVAGSGAGVVLMHMRGDPSDMQERTEYADVVDDVASELGDAVRRARDGGIDPSRIVVDPGFGFAKTAPQSLLLLRHLGSFAALGHPVLVGPSRKSFLGEIVGVPPRERTAATVAACVLAWLGGATIFRVHDVAPVVQALEVARTVAPTVAPSVAASVAATGEAPR